MGAWAVEHGTFWAIDTSRREPFGCGSGLPLRFHPSNDLDGAVTFAEIAPRGLPTADADGLIAVIDMAAREPFRQRLRAGRRCFVAKVGGQIAGYGWITRGPEYAGELERHFNLRDDEAYIWDCVTLPPWRGKHLYSALLNHIVYRLHDEGIFHTWIGAARRNRPSIRGIVNAGFKSIVDIVYRRFLRVTTMWVIETPTAPRPLLRAAYRILRARHERRIGRLFVGYL